MSYGADIWCADSLITGRQSSGVMTVVLGLYRRLITPRGTLQGLTEDEEEANYGLDVVAYVGAVGPEVAERALPGLVEGELLKDPRVASAAVTVLSVVEDDGTVSLEISGDVTLVDSDETFTIVLGVSEVTLALLGVTQ